VKSGHGAVELEKAIYQSCDVFFYTLAEKLGIDRIAKYASALGLGQKTGIDLPNEVSGVMPSEEWKIRNFKQKWFAGRNDLGRDWPGSGCDTPVQLMRAIAAISMAAACCAHVINPAICRRAWLRRPATRKSGASPWIRMDGPSSPMPWPGAVAGGTAPSAHIAGIDIAGKTGSAQIVSLALRAKHANNDDFAQNGWFVGFTPRRNPEIIVAVLFEGGEHGKLAHAWRLK